VPQIATASTTPTIPTHQPSGSLAFNLRGRRLSHGELDGRALSPALLAPVRSGAGTVVSIDDATDDDAAIAPAESHAGALMNDRPISFSQDGDGKARTCVLNAATAAKVTIDGKTPTNRGAHEPLGAADVPKPA
jgi:hypothetical protein